VYQTIHVWSNDPWLRGTFSEMLGTVKTVCRSVKHTAHYGWFVRNMTQRIIPDNTTKQPLLHGIVEVEFKFS